MIEIIKWMQQLSGWITHNTTQAVIFILLLTNALSYYGWKKANEYGGEMFKDYMVCNRSLQDCKNDALNEAHNNLHEKDSLINLLNAKIQSMNNVINNNKETIKKVKSNI